MASHVCTQIFVAGSEFSPASRPPFSFAAKPARRWLPRLAGLCFFACLGLRAAEPAPSPTPGHRAPEILARLNRAHPRLLATADDFLQLKQKAATDATAKNWCDALRKNADRILGEEPSRYVIPDGLRLLETSRRVMNRIYVLALMFRLEGEPKYAERAWHELEAAADFQDWNPRHFLDTAEMTHAFAIAYDWLYDFWTPAQRERLRQAMVTKGFMPALKVYRAANWWVTARHNWNQVCNGGIGMGALALGDVEPQLAGEILEDALNSLPLAMAEFAPDGAWKEGPGYWNYATTYNVIFLAGLHTALGTDFGLSKMTGFGETGFFPLYLTGPFGRTFNYADGGDRAIRAPQMFWFARQFHQPVFAWYERELAAPAPLDLVWLPAAGQGPRELGLPLDRYFRDAEVAVMRSAWEDPKALFAGFKAGDNKANHSHLDLGSFVFDALGARWAVDLGADDYNLPGYFGKQRFTYYRLRAEGQNTLVLNPGTGPDQDPRAEARIVRFRSAPERAFAVADLSPAYRHSARKVWRGLALLDRRRLLVQDEIAADKPANVWWFMHTPAKGAVQNGGHSAVLEQLGQKVRVSMLSPADATFQMMDAQPLPESPHPERQAKNERMKKLAIHLAGQQDCRLAVLLEPLTEGKTQTAEPPKLSPLDQW